jgi:hypothetical protein
MEKGIMRRSSVSALCKLSGYDWKSGMRIIAARPMPEAKRHKHRFKRNQSGFICNFKKTCFENIFL